MKILLDAMGGDNAPDAAIRGAVKAVKEIQSELCLIGNEALITSKIKEFYGKTLKEISPRLSVENTTEIITMEDIPTIAIKNKKDSSMVKGFNMLKNGDGDVFISAGNSGALLTGATLLIGRIKGIDRPALAGIMPSYKGQIVLMDCGANTNCKPLNMLQFAQMSSIYMSNTLKIKKPKIGLLNIGTEENKGNDLVKSSYKLIKKFAKDLNINFMGNIEGREAFLGDIDVVIADGFTGNVFLKSVEGLGKFIKRSLMESLTGNILKKIAVIPSLPGLKKFSKAMDYKEYGGALFLGIKKPVVKAHGSSDEKLFRYTIKQAEQFVKNKAVEQMTEIYESSETKEKMAEIKDYLLEIEKK